MPTYPPTLLDMEVEISVFKYLPQATTQARQNALDKAKGEIESVVPLLLDEGVTPSLSANAWGVCLDLAILKMRWRVERDNESGDVPKSLQTERREINERLERIKMLEEVPRSLSFSVGVIAAPPTANNPLTGRPSLAPLYGNAPLWTR